MKKQTVMWTALPNGIVARPQEGGARLRLSVFVSPRLQTNEGMPRPRLAQFPDFLDWPAKALDAGFSVQFNNGTPIEATVVRPEAQPSPSTLWQGIFDGNTYVEPFEFPDMERSVIRSYSVRNVVAHLKSVYQSVAVESPTEPPRLEIDPRAPAAGNLAPVQRLMQEIAPPRPQAQQLNRELGQQLRSARFKAIANPSVEAAAPGVTQVKAVRGQATPALAPGTTQAMMDFQQLKFFHGLERVDTGVMPRPRVRIPIMLPQMDFHQIVSSLGEYPQLMRRLGLVIELEVPFQSSMLSSQWVEVIPDWEPDMTGSVDVTPRTRCNVTANNFVAVPGPEGGDIQNGMLQLNDEDHFEIGQVDVDGAAMKTLDTASTLSETKGEADAALPAMRSSGIWVAKVNRAHEFAAQILPRAIALDAAVRKLEVAAPVRTPTRTVGRRPGRTAIRVTPTKPEEQIDLYAEDLVRGYRVDIWDQASGAWQSLCKRVGQYRFTKPQAGGAALNISDEGCISMAATQAADDSSDDLFLHETLFRWEGWSLSAPRPGIPVPQDGVRPDTGNEYGLEVSFTPVPGSLPRLRFRNTYRARARLVDLAGNSLAAEDADGSIATEAMEYTRQEPVSAPAVVPRTDLESSPGESVDRIVIRSFNDALPKDQVPTSEASERHVAPPKTSEIMAETHGMFDGPQGMMAGAASYQMIVNKDQSLAEFYNVDQLQLPYLPDPLAVGAVIRFRSLEAAQGADQTVRVPFPGDWPELRPFRIVVVERTGANNVPRFDESRRILFVPLEKGETAEVWLSCAIPAEKIQDMGMWRWTVEGVAAANLKQAGIAPAERSLLRSGLADMQRLPQVRGRLNLQQAQVSLIQDLNLSVSKGLHWMITPSRKLTLVHAVQQPLVVPQFRTLKSTKNIGDTFARLQDHFPIDGKSTAKVDVLADWEEPVDSISEPEPRTIQGNRHVFDVQVEPDDTELHISEPIRLAQIRRTPAATVGPAAPTVERVVPPARGVLQPRPVLPQVGMRHEFGDTKHRRVNYTAVATTRYREYLPFTDEEIESGARVITRSSDQKTLDILNSARPSAPKLMYVVPTFGWSRDDQSGRVTSTRRGGGLRVYLERPWYSSGEGELLGVVLAQTPRMTLAAMTAQAGISDTLKPYVTQWGQDPIWASGATKLYLSAGDFRKATASEDDLSLDELPGARVAVAGHEVGYDPVRQLWYCDVEVDPGTSYFPFIRMALARYQPKSVKTAQSDVKLSRVVLADFAQLAPDRSATITFDPRDAAVVGVGVRGATYSGAASNKMATVEVTVEQQRPNVDGDLGWAPVPDGTVDLSRTGRADSGLWTGRVPLPANRGSQPFRLVVREYEWFEIDGQPLAILGSGVIRPTKARLVYADSIEI